MPKYLLTLLCCLVPGGTLCASEEKEAGERMTLTINEVEYAFRWCPPGTFMMGSPESEEGRYEDETQHEVMLTQGFWMLETQVTQEMWESVTGKKPSEFKESKKLPVENVSWEDCQEYIKKLNALSATPEGYTFSLPTEAQWEYACRAGTITPYHFGGILNGDQANCDGRYPYGTETEGENLGETTEVGSYPANAWGLYDMHGNVYEWCLDWYASYPDENVTDPTVASSGSSRVLRGGSWANSAGFCRSAFRDYDDPTDRHPYIGLRLAIIPEN